MARCPLGNCGDTRVQRAHRAPALPRPDSPATRTFDPELSLMGVVGDEGEIENGAWGSKLAVVTRRKPELSP